MSTKLFKAMKKLRAKLYWCLTGTPVQNSLEDLAALISFIRASPLDDLHKFRKHVIKPLTKGSENGVENLRQLLDSVCLRRTKQLLNLPEAVFELHTLRFSVREEIQYNDTRDKLVKLINETGLKSKNQKGYLGVFQLQLQLRRLCNHGTFQRASLENDEFDPDQAIALLKKQKTAKCEACSVNITGIQGIEEKRNGSFTVCGHLLCMKCVPKLKSALKVIDGRDGCFQCSLCPDILFGNYFVDEEGSTKSSKSGSKNLSAWQYFDKEGCSTKVSTVVDDIEHHNTAGKW
jgi:SNF2 family DNA or RNA helicase